MTLRRDYKKLWILNLVVMSRLNVVDGWTKKIVIFVGVKGAMIQLIMS